MSCEHLRESNKDTRTQGMMSIKSINGRTQGDIRVWLIVLYSNWTCLLSRTAGLLIVLPSNRALVALSISNLWKCSIKI